MKIFLVSVDTSFLYDIANNIYKLNESLTISPCFSTDTQFKDIITPNMYYLDTDTVMTAYKNNSLLYVDTIKQRNFYIYLGVTIDDFYNNEIFIMNMKEYNSISKKIFESNDIITIWIDSKNNNLSQFDMIEVNFFIERIKDYNYLYFINDEKFIENTICKYINGTEEERNKILLENS